ncbi:GNAT family N-acetyltransferase [Streptomyces sp. HUCO-GS316]|nr:GNAT family N-acetyltransferase [Streptomyces sp. HUCO-GS316]
MPPIRPILRIRTVTEEDLPELHRLDNEVFERNAYPYFVLRQFFDAYGGHLLVIDDGANLLGYVFATAPDDKVSWILSLAVRPGLQGQGLGRRLMGEILDHVRSAGVREVWLTVEPGNDTAVLLYRSMGFLAEDAPREDYFGPGQHRLVMRLTL